MSRILIVEDEESIADLEKDYLELSGFEVDIETNGRAGLKAVQMREYDLFILDLMLPDVDGFEICREIRSTKDVPILMVSAKKDDIDKIRGLGLGADDYITKPFSPSELVARVKAHLARYERLVGTGAYKNDVIQIRGLKIDKPARRVWVNGKDCGIAWTAPYEVDITEALKKGKNTIEIEVVNTWHNALRGLDNGKAPYDGIWTNAKYRTKGNELLPAGLLAPPMMITTTN